MFGPLPHITVIRKLFKLLDNLWNILHNGISNGTTCIFTTLWTYNGLETQRDNQPLSLYSQIIFWIWRCDFHLVQTTKFQRDVQGDVFLAIFDIYLFPKIATTAIFHVHRCELTKCKLFLPERLPSGAIMINIRWCYNL